jgi:protocatechuate 3,4-dioxygenase beta subunit
MLNLARRVAVFVLAVLMLGPAPFVLSQSNNASIDGTITDPNGAVVAGASVDLTSKDTNITSHFVSDASGLYSFRNVVPGTYRLRVKTQGFGEYCRTALLCGSVTDSAEHRIDS